MYVCRSGQACNKVIRDQLSVGLTLVSRKSSCVTQLHYQQVHPCIVVPSACSSRVKGVTRHAEAHSGISLVMPITVNVTCHAWRYSEMSPIMQLQRETSKLVPCIRVDDVFLVLFLQKLLPCSAPCRINSLCLVVSILTKMYWLHPHPHNPGHEVLAM